ncbi:MAG TPA: LTA synthase family protein [Stellaceae bacterium]
MGSLWLLQLFGGAGLVALGWLLPRRVARARLRAVPALALDVAPFALGVGLLLLATARPLFAGLLAAALGSGLALADQVMRDTLREPVVFSEMSELPQVFTHPHLYLPFAGPGLVIGGAAGAVALGLALLLLEPPVWTPEPGVALLLAAVALAAGWLMSRQPLLGTLGAFLRRLAPTGEPFADAERLGPLGMLLTHTIVARSERARRRAALGAPAIGRRDCDRDVPVVLVQCESFFDVRRISPSLPGDLLPGVDACMATGAMSGRLEVPGWGANTMRTEFAVLTGIPEGELGYDRFNPYYALARSPVTSQVWRLRQAGYRTICLHPFDRRFFRRDLAMPALGFEQFLGRETLGGSRRPPYYSDPDLARDILRLIDAEGPRTFLFAITMANHGPWLDTGRPIDPVIAGLFDRAHVPQRAALLRYLDGLRRSDEMLQILMTGLEQSRSPAILGFYGDHLPSLSQAYAHFGFDEPHSDYLIWPGEKGVAPLRCDLPAHRLGAVIVDALLGEHPAVGQARAPAEPALDLGACLAWR